MNEHVDPSLANRVAIVTGAGRGLGRAGALGLTNAGCRVVIPYGPSKAALESETAIWAQDLAGTGVTVNAILPGGATVTGMIPDGVPDRMRASLLNPEVIVPALLWLVSTRSDGITGKRVIANRWREGDLAPVGEAMEDAGWAPVTG